jgi:hypothetical protein
VLPWSVIDMLSARTVNVGSGILRAQNEGTHGGARDEREQECRGTVAARPDPGNNEGVTSLRVAALFAIGAASCGGSTAREVSSRDAGLDAATEDSGSVDAIAGGDAPPALAHDADDEPPACPVDASPPMTCTSTCCGDLVCMSGDCCLPLGQACTVSSQCCSPGICGGPGAPGMCVAHPQ